MSPALPEENVHSAVDVMLGQVNATLAYLHRVFLVEDLIDSCKVCVSSIHFQLEYDQYKLLQ